MSALLERTTPQVLARAATAPNADPALEGRQFSGYAAVFNSPTRIDSWEGMFDEQIAPGAFRRSIRSLIPKFQFDHGRSNFGSLPLGVVTDIYEDERGLMTEATLAASGYWEPVREAIATGALDGMSFRFSVIREEWRDRDGKLIKPNDVQGLLYGRGERGPLLRTLKEITVPEVGPVVWPAYTNTTAAVRSQSPSLSSALAHRRLRLLEAI